uniref:Uncharacterized protein n=1 Tax=Ananas comosus var. bracteatus TaxID=296719 RepID=A0A6V7QGH9_ANACO|nr:unnamed protein product [Ananas comosus var. bracteatus]
MANGTRLRQQTTSYNQSFEEALQSARDVNQKLDVLIEALQKEEARRHEIMMQENARRHEQILELIRSRFVHAREKEITVQDPKEEKELIPIPIPIPLEKRVSSLTNSVIDKPAAVNEVEQRHLGILQMEDSNGHDASRPEGLLRLHATQPPPTKSIPNVETRNIEHSSSDRSKLRDNIIPPPIRTNNGEEPPLGTHKLQESEEEPNPQWPATSKRTMMQGRCYGYGEEYITGQQCKDSSLRMLPAQKRGEVGAEFEAAKEEGCEPQQVEDGNVYEATSIKESDNQTQLILNDDSILHSFVDFGIAKGTGVEFTTVAPLIVIADRGPKMLNKSYYPRFAKNEQGHQFLADSRELGLNNSDIVLRIDWMKEYRQVPFDPGPNKGTTHSIEGVDLMLSPGYLKTYKLMRLGPEQGKVTIYSMEERVSQRPVTPIKLHQFSHQQKREVAVMQRQQEKNEDYKVQRLVQNSRLAGACYVWDYVNEYKKLGTVLKMPHPCSRFLAYEQDKLQESDELIAYLNNGLNQKHQGRSIYKIETIAIMLVVATWEQNVKHKQLVSRINHGDHKQLLEQKDHIVIQQLEQNCNVGLRAKRKIRLKQCHFGLSPARWWKKGQVIHFFEEPPNKQQQRKEYNADKRRSKGVFEVKEKLCLKLLLCEQPIMPLEGYLRLTLNQFGLYYISEHTSLVARRLRLPEGPKGESLPQQEPPSMLPTRIDRHVWARIGNTSNQHKVVQENRTEVQIWLKRSNFEEEECAAGGNQWEPQTSQRDPSLRTRMVLRGRDCNNPEE